jgi:hypothetical protein
MFLAAAAPAVAQDAGADWSGEGALSAGNTTGNTETSDLGIALKLKRKGDLWSQSGEFAADYGETDGIETKNRLYGAAQVDRKLSDLWSLYGRGTAEKDEFSGSKAAISWALAPPMSCSTAIRRAGPFRAAPATRSTKYGRRSRRRRPQKNR